MAIAKLIGKNTGWITESDDLWISENYDKPPRQLVAGLLSRLFDDIDLRYPTDSDKACAIIAIARQNNFSRTKADVDKERFEKLVSLPIVQSDAIFALFVLWWKGYTNEDVENAVSSLETDRHDFNSAILHALKDLRIHKRDAQSKKDTYKEQRLNKIGRDLFKLRHKVSVTYTNPYGTAHLKVFREVQYRRGFRWYFNEMPNDYLGIYASVRRLDPSLISFPLRHLMFIAAGDYDYLARMWSNGANRDALIEKLLEGYGKIVDEQIIPASYAFVEHISKTNRSLVLSEIFECWKNKCHAAVSMLCITQVEGLLWDFADYLNSHGVPIYKIDTDKKINYCKWDSKNKTYKRYDGKIETVAAIHHSGRELLRHTRLSSDINHELYYYLIDDFYEDRNSLLHRSISGRNLETEAASALFCLLAVIDDIQEYVKKTRL